MARLTVYVADWCGACKQEMPRIRQSARKLGYSVDVVDIERCSGTRKAKCDSVDFVPHVELNGAEISVAELERRANAKS